MNKQKAKEFIEILKRSYIEKHTKKQPQEELLRDIHIEEQETSGYHGRELFELIQNADDAFQKSINNGKIHGEELTIQIVLKDNILTITNSGTAFDEDGVKSISQGNNSSKSVGYIGSKGTGFRSLLNWSDKIIIRSGYFNLEFSKDYARSIFESISDTEQIQKQLRIKKDLYIPFLSVPRFIDSNEDYFNETTIEIHLNELAKDKFDPSNQIDDIDDKILLFLPNVSTILIDKNGEKIKITRKIQKEIDFRGAKVKHIKIDKLKDETESSSDFDVYTTKYKEFIESNGEKKTVDIIIANQVNNKEKQLLYNYFPLLDAESPFNCLLHATYHNLSAQRNSLTYTKENELIIKQQLKCLIDFSTYYLSVKNFSEAQKLIIPQSVTYSLGGGFSKFDVTKFYYELLKDHKFLLNLNNEAISLNDSFEIIWNVPPSYFKGTNFSNYIYLERESNLYKFVKFLANFHGINCDLNEEILCEKINTLDLSIEQRVSCFIWWDNISTKALPKLLLKEDGTWLSLNDECMFKEGSLDFEIPNWVKIPALDTNYQKELIRQSSEIKVIKDASTASINHSIARAICQTGYFGNINFTYRDRSTIIPSINSSVTNFEESKEFLELLLKNYSSDVYWFPPSLGESKGKYAFPSYEGTVEQSDSLFLDCSISKRIMGDKYKRIINPEQLGIDPQCLKGYENFVKKFGVKKYPSVALCSDPVLPNYEKMIKGQIKTVEKEDRQIEQIKFEYPYIPNLIEILSEAETSDILEWVNEDINLKNELSNKFISSDKYKLEFKFKRHKSFDQPSKFYELSNYILYCFNNCKWIQIDDKRLTPKDVLLDINGNKTNIIPSAIPILSKKMLLKFASDLQVDESIIQDILKLFSFCQRITDLKSNDFYNLLLKIPAMEDQENAIRLSKMIYGIIESPDFNKSFSDSRNKKIFLEKGKLLTLNHGFQKATDVYVRSEKIVDDKNTYVIASGQRRNNENLKRCLFCKDYEKNFVIDKDSIILSSLDKDFWQYFENYRRFLVPYYINKNKNLENYFPTLKIHLVCSVGGKLDEEYIEITEDYKVLREGPKNWYILYNESTLNYQRLSFCIETIVKNIANSAGFETRVFAQMFSVDDETKKEIIMQDFGTMDLVEETTLYERNKKSFVDTIVKIDPKYKIDTMPDFNDLSSIDSSKIVLKIFNDLNIVSINEFKIHGFEYDFDFTEYYKLEIERIIQNEKQNYKNFLFNSLAKRNSIEDHCSFLKKYYLFEDYTLQGKVIKRLNCLESLFNIFGNWKTQTYSNCEDVYRNNLKSFDVSEENADLITNNDRLKTYIYFNHKKEFNELINELAEKKANDEKNEGGYSRFFGLIPNKSDIVYPGPKFNEHKEEKASKKRHGSTNEEIEHGKNKKKKRIGNIGELLIYNLLVDTYGEKNVYPKSEAFETLGILDKGQSTSGKCDIEYRDSDGNIQFVEVKSGDQNQFFITPSELEFAKKNASNYHLFVVYDIDKERPNYFEIEKEFWKNKHYKKTEIIERIQVTIV